MKFAQHAKTFKPEKLEGQPKPWHLNVGALPSLPSPLMLGNHKQLEVLKNMYGGAAGAVPQDVFSWSGGLSEKSELGGNGGGHAGPDSATHIGGPVMIDHTTIHPSNITIDLALDALKSHGVMFKSVSMSLTAQHGTVLSAEMDVLDHETAMAMHKWFYGKGG